MGRRASSANAVVNVGTEPLTAELAHTIWIGPVWEPEGAGDIPGDTDSKFSYTATGSFLGHGVDDVGFGFDLTSVKVEFWGWPPTAGGGQKRRAALFVTLKIWGEAAEEQVIYSVGWNVVMTGRFFQFAPSV